MGAGDYMEVTLGSPRILSETRLCLAAGEDGIGLRSLSIYGRETAEGPWRMLQSLAEAPSTEGGWLIAGWPPQMLSALRVVPDPFPGKRVTIIRLAAYPGVSSATSPDNLAFGRSYTVRPAPESHYPDRAAELTDGILTRQGFADGHTVGWSGAPRVTVEVALPKGTSVEAVRCHVQGGGYAAVHFPRALSVAISNDGKQWRLLSDSRARIEPAPVDPGVPQEISLRWLRQEGPPGGLPARWVRLTLLPAGWLMLSEVEVLSGGRNVARSQPYRLRPLPTAKEITRMMASSSRMVLLLRYGPGPWVGMELRAMWRWTLAVSAGCVPSAPTCSVAARRRLSAARHPGEPLHRRPGLDASCRRHPLPARGEGAYPGRMGSRRGESPEGTLCAPPPSADARLDDARRSGGPGHTAVGHGAPVAGPPVARRDRDRCRMLLPVRASRALVGTPRAAMERRQPAGSGAGPMSPTRHPSA